MNEPTTHRPSTTPHRPSTTSRRPLDADLFDALAMWVDHCLVPDWSPRRDARVYGIDVLDPDDLAMRSTPHAARLTLLAEGWVYDLLESPAAAVAPCFAAVALVCYGRATDLRTGERRRSRTVVVAAPGTMTAVNRLRGGTPQLAGRPTGPVADALAQWHRPQPG